MGFVMMGNRSDPMFNVTNNYYMYTVSYPQTEVLYLLCMCVLESSPFLGCSLQYDVQCLCLIVTVMKHHDICHSDLITKKTCV